MKRAFESLLETFSLKSISPSHTVAACDALCAFFDTGLASRREETRRLILSSVMWSAVFEACLDRFEYSKPKPMRQVLLSLVKLLTNQAQEERLKCLQYIGDAVIGSVIVGEPRSRLKASLVALEVFIRKKAISPLDTILFTREWLVNHHRKWRHALDEKYKSIGMDVVQLTDEGHLDSKTAATVLIQGLLIQSRNADFSSISGSVIALLLQGIQADPVVQHRLNGEKQDPSSVWTIPVKHIMLKNLDFLDQLSNHVLKPIFTVDPNGFRLFIDQLHLKSLITGEMADTPPELILLFSALQVGKKIGLVDEDRKLLVIARSQYFGEIR